MNRAAAAALVLLLLCHPAAADERGRLLAAVTALDAGLSAGLSLNELHRHGATILAEAERMRSAGGAALQAVHELLAASAATDAVWRDAFAANLCNDPEDMAEAVRELLTKTEAALRALAP